MEHPNESDCPFCKLQADHDKMLAKGELGFAVRQISMSSRLPEPDRYLLVPYAHITDVFDLPDRWTQTQRELLFGPKGLFASKRPDFNLSWNSGVGAGQTTAHLHCWVIVRREESEPVTYGKGMSLIISDANLAMGSPTGWSID